MNGIAIRIFIPLLLYLIQQYFLAPLLGGFVHPELLLCWLLSWTFLSGSREGIRMGIYCGFLMDFSSTTFFGFYMIFGGLIGWFFGKIHRQISRNTISLPIISVVIVTVVSSFLLLVFASKFKISFVMIGSWVLLLFEQSVWNTLFMIPVYGMATYLWYIFCE